MTVSQLYNFTVLRVISQKPAGSYDRTSARYCKYRELESRTVHVQGADQFLHPARQVTHKHYSRRCGFLTVHAIECACWVYEACIDHAMDLMPRRVFDVCVLNIQARLRPPSFQIIAWSWICLRLYISDPFHLHPQYCNWVLYPVRIEYIKRW